MNKNKRKKILISSIIAPIILLPTITLTSLAIVDNNTLKKYYNDSLDDEYYFDCSKLVDNLYFKLNKFISINKQLSTFLSAEWYKNVIKSSINPETGEVWEFQEYDSDGAPVIAYCNSQAQALGLYSCYWGDFWNNELHHGLEPTDKLYTMSHNSFDFQNKTFKIRGSDYKYITESLKPSNLSLNIIAYHGVEFMEDEFYEQLKAYIKYDSKNETYDYSSCVGKEIITNGFISTTTDQKISEKYCDGFNWTNDTYNLPLKEKFVFKIYIPKNVNGVAYISWLKFANAINKENQLLIDRKTKFKIKKHYKKNDINYFDLKFLGY